MSHDLRLRRPRAVLTTLGVALTGALGIGLALAGCGALGERIDTVGDAEFETPLAIPPLAPSRLEGGTRVFELEAQAGESAFLPGAPTPTWGFNGAYLGPTLRAARGEDVAVEVANALDEPTTVHWHGMHLPAKMDGGPHQMVEPGETWIPEWTIDQPAATLWYHPHPHGETEKHVQRGLAGLFILDDEEETALELPREYGVDDVPVIVQDVRFAADGAFAYGQRAFAGALGDRLLVNGTLDPVLEVETERVRLRLLNASTARVYDFGFDDARPFQLIASDGGLLAAPVDAENLVLSPGERAEIVVALAPGETTMLRSIATPEALGMHDVTGGMNGAADRFDVLRLRAAADLRPSPAIPPVLTSFERMPREEASVERAFRLNGFDINDRKMDMGRIDDVVTVGTTEIWTVENTSGMPHSFHVHDVQFQVLTAGGAPPPPELAGWKDTVFLHPEMPYELIMRFEDHADPETPYMYHCHLLWHEDRGMMGQFVVIEPGQQVRMTGETHDHH